MSAKKCPECQRPLPEEAANSHYLYCDFCEQLWEVCPHCNEMLAEKDVFVCPKCQRSLQQIPCPECCGIIYTDTTECPHCRTTYKVEPCAYCHQPTIVSKKLDICPHCEQYWHERCPHCQTPYVNRGCGEQCPGCGRIL